MPDSTEIRMALTRKALAAARHRAALGRLLGLSESEVLAIQHLALAGQLTPSALGNLLRLTSGGTTALVQRLERAGYVAREPHPVDGRSTLLRLTTKAEGDAIEAFAPLVAELDRLANELSASERGIVGRFLAAVADAAEHEADAAVRVAEDRARAAVGTPVPALWA